jgi:hypothetical protein
LVALTTVIRYYRALALRMIADHDTLPGREQRAPIAVDEGHING